MTWFALGLQAASAVQADVDVAFRGYEVSGDEVRFSLSRREPDGRVVDAWVPPGRVRDGFLVRGFDAETEIVQVECDGRTLYLALAGAQVAAMPVIAGVTAASTPLEMANAIGRNRAQRLREAGMVAPGPSEGR